MNNIAILSFLVGKKSPLGPQGVSSAIAKRPIKSRVHLSQSGLDGDEQGDLIRHGGPEKALHHYPFDHYSAWRAEIGCNPLLSCPGAFGENISTDGVNESDVAIGDVYKIGEAVIEVSQGRQPCWKLNERFNNSKMAAFVQSSGRTGWYYRVLQPGMVCVEDRLCLTERRSAEWTIERLVGALYKNCLDREELDALAQLPRLTESWRSLAQRRLETRTIEDWQARLHGPALPHVITKTLQGSVDSST